MSLPQLVAIGAFGALAIGFGAAVFRTSSMVRSAFALLGSMAAIGALFLAMDTEFLGVLQLMMMATEMTVMASFMVMYMMDPGGMGQMDMTHQKKLSVGVSLSAALLVLVLLFSSGWGPLVASAPDPARQIHDLGIELMSRAMLIFETAGLSIFVAMIAATCVAIASRRR